MDDRFGKMDDRFGKMDDRFGKMDDRFGKMEVGLARVERKLDQFIDVQMQSERGSSNVVCARWSKVRATCARPLSPAPASESRRSSSRCS